MMSDGDRRTVRFTGTELQHLKRLQKSTGLSVSDIIRRAVRLSDKKTLTTSDEKDILKK